MKKAFLLFAIAGVFAACGGGDGKTETAEKKEEAKTPDDPAYTEGLTLVAQSNCPTCHKIDEQFTGPAYRDVAKKYESTSENVTMLANKIIKGGTGNWGTIPMTAHPEISQGDAEKMVKYILMLKK